MRRWQWSAWAHNDGARRSVAQLRMQAEGSPYRSTLQAIRAIVRDDGLRGFYRGFAANLPQLVLSPVYWTTLEFSRRAVDKLGVRRVAGPMVADFGPGVAASLAAQTVIVPCDVVRSRGARLRGAPFTRGRRAGLPAQRC